MTMLEDHLQTNRIQGGICFQVSLPMNFRIFGEKVWHEGWTETMSVTEMLFRTSKSAEPGKGMEFRISLPSPQHGSRGGTIVGRAKVLRCFGVTELPGQNLIVASVSRPRLLHFDADSSKG